MITKVQLWAAPRSTQPIPSRPLLFHVTGHTNPAWSLCGTARHLADHKRVDATTVPPKARCRALGCIDAWPPLPKPVRHPAAICQTDHCTALATHATSRLGITETLMLCEWCAAHYRHRHYPAASVTRLEAYGVALAAATPAGFLYRITTGILGELRPCGIGNAAEARLRLDQARRDGWAVQVQPAGGWRAAHITTGFAGELTQVISLDPYPAGS
ncbi:hypothetical protein [Actinacidiphila sp. ITFR-21]|uniref:hypothetical protein n=1 Tax=Actinacidiphila sp. ITFR-21 TaxID=3075199 RepID=UPI00288AB566|nr:hypothetical protein [Streptomyces sp. ITFR-21]WNI19141.1 hypothetical protein RLT57_28795 [Streptomyces sp. ITFR-21]